MTILVTGAGGMLGREVVLEARQRGHQVVALAGRAALDLTEHGAVDTALRTHQPEAIVNCAAWTDVDGAERTPDAAWRDNTLVAWHLASACAQHGCWLLQVSTDFVFAGEKGSPYDEFDPIGPRSVYGKTKAAAEQLVRQLLPTRHVIARTAFLFGPQGDNLIEKILRAAGQHPELRFVEDQIVSPTHTADLARLLLELAEFPLAGTYHITSGGHCSLFDLARETVRLAGLSTPVLPISFADYVARAQPLAARPRYAALAHRALQLRGMDTLPQWKTALESYLQRRSAVLPPTD